MSGALFTLILLVALCADSLPNQTLIPMAVVLVALALVVAVAGHRKTASDAATSKAAVRGKLSALQFVNSFIDVDTSIFPFLCGGIVIRLLSLPVTQFK